jgi:SAM-dependent methyltransferase
VLGFGSAYGHELKPIADRLKRITIVEPSDALVARHILGVPVEYAKPTPQGELPFAADAFDLITCFGVLHHIPNVSAVLGELFRCLMPGGWLLLREPTVSMGDWRRPRAGLTKRERGIPIGILRRMVRSAGFRVLSEARCNSSVIRALQGRIGKRSVWNSPVAVAIDSLLCRLLSWNEVYHAAHWIQKVRPASLFLVLTKPRQPVTSGGRK